MKKKGILIISAILIVNFIAYIKGCAYLPIEGTVVDVKNGRIKRNMG